MLDQSEIDQHFKLLAAHRRTLSHYLNQQAIFSAGHTPPPVTHGIDDAREQIRFIKMLLRSHGIEVDDHSFDEPCPHNTIQNKDTAPTTFITPSRLQVDFHHLSPEAQFWTWFAANAGRLLTFKGRNAPVLRELSEELAKVANGLTYELSVGETVEHEFIVSADGHLERFSDVIRLVGAAPSIPGWRVIAFRQPKDTRFVVSVGKQKLAADDIWFRTQPHGDRLDLILYIKRLAQRDQDFIQAAVFFALDSALGEYDVETKIGVLDIQDAPKNARQMGLKSFHELSRVVRSWSPLDTE